MKTGNEATTNSCGMRTGNEVTTVSISSLHAVHYNTALADKPRHTHTHTCKTTLEQKSNGIMCCRGFNNLLLLSFSYLSIVVSRGGSSLWALVSRR